MRWAALVIIGLLPGLIGGLSNAAQGADSEETCDALAERWLTGQSGLRLAPDALNTLSGCYQATDGSWFLPIGSEDTRLPRQVLSEAERQQTNMLRDDLMGELDLFVQGLERQPDPDVPIGPGTGTMKDAVERLYDPVKRPPTGHLTTANIGQGVSQWYERDLIAYLQDPNRTALNNYVLWWGLRRRAAFPSTDCLAIPPICGALAGQLGLNTNG